MLEIGKVKDKSAPILRGEEIVAVLSASNWKEEATLTRGDSVWNCRTRKGRITGALSTDPELTETGEQARFVAERASFWRGTWDLALDGIRYTLEPKSFWRGTHRFERNGQEVAVTGTAGTWSTRITLEAAEDVPLDHQLFFLWVAFVLNRRATNAAVAAGAGVAVAGGSS